MPEERPLSQKIARAAHKLAAHFTEERMDDVITLSPKTTSAVARLMGAYGDQLYGHKLATELEGLLNEWMKLHPVKD